MTSVWYMTIQSLKIPVVCIPFSMKYASINFDIVFINQLIWCTDFFADIFVYGELLFHWILNGLRSKEQPKYFLRDKCNARKMLEQRIIKKMWSIRMQHNLDSILVMVYLSIHYNKRVFSCLVHMVLPFFSLLLILAGISVFIPCWRH